MRHNAALLVEMIGLDNRNESMVIGGVFVTLSTYERGENFYAEWNSEVV